MSLSVTAKAFVPQVEDKPINKKALSVDVPEFIPNIFKKNDRNDVVSNPTVTSKISLSKQASTKEKFDDKPNPEVHNSSVRKKQLSKSNSKSLSCNNTAEKKHYTNKVLGPSKSFNPRHDLNWAQSDGINKIKESYNARHDKNWYNCVPSKGKQNNLLQKSDSVNWEKTGGNHHKEILQTYSTGVSPNSNRNSGTVNKVCMVSSLVKSKTWVFCGLFYISLAPLL